MKATMPLIRGEATAPCNIGKHMTRARVIARCGHCADWSDVLNEVRKENKRAAYVLLIWAGAMERDEIDHLCKGARIKASVSLADATISTPPAE
jgi:hypothetical protein